MYICRFKYLLLMDAITNRAKIEKLKSSNQITKKYLREEYSQYYSLLIKVDPSKQDMGI